MQSLLFVGAKSQALLQGDFIFFFNYTYFFAVYVPGSRAFDRVVYNPQMGHSAITIFVRGNRNLTSLKFEMPTAREPTDPLTYTLACSEVESRSETLVSIKSTNSFRSNCLGKPSTSCTEVSLLLAGLALPGTMHNRMLYGCCNSKKPVKAMDHQVYWEWFVSFTYSRLIVNSGSAHELPNKRKALCNESFISLCGSRNRKQPVWALFIQHFIVRNCKV